ncbi:MAG: hypothetical protein CMF25_05495 [Kangiellaceae bacterium]|nr:hypothetical protein [Kangiellaceae bacterium]|tara:strand:+ start:8610 stop:9209 length:600 start_codon:yes stop_codon:yes gene_type:complete
MINKSVFQIVLGDDWERLGAVVRRHYFLKPESDDYICVSGEMLDTSHSAIAKLLIPFGLLFGALVPFKGKNIPTDVHYNASPSNSNIYWNRVFKFARGNFHFKSHMVPVASNHVIEYVRFGVGIRLRVTAEEGALVFRDIGYVWNVFGFLIPIPGKWLMGNVYVEERPVDDNRFSMQMILTHPWFGVLFKYSGHFALSQ